MVWMRWFAGAGILVGAMAIGGCASGATAEGMTVKAMTAAGRVAPSDVAKTLTIDEVVGGSQTHPLDLPQIDNDSFKTALALSLRDAGLLAEGSGARYRVTATILILTQPREGIDMTVGATIRYRLTDTKNGAIVFEDEIVANHTARLGDAAIGVTRMRLATEGAARKSIAMFIEKVKAGKVEPKQIALAH